MRPVTLSGRLRTVAGMVTGGSRVCDVGCDHGFVPIYLVQQGISPSVLAMDLREGPLGAAREHVTAYGLEEQIETRLSDGLHNYTAGEADSLICAGMGGGLMRRILEAEREKTDSFREMILQPQSEIEKFRQFLRENGYGILDEEMIEEDGKFYQVIRASGKDVLSMEPDCGGACGAAGNGKRRSIQQRFPSFLRESYVNSKTDTARCCCEKEHLYFYLFWSGRQPSMRRFLRICGNRV